MIVRQLIEIISGSTSWIGAVSIGIRRGSHIVNLNFDSRFAMQWAINFPAPAGTWSNSNSGRVTGSNDSDGNRWVMHSTAAFTASNDLMYRTSAGRQWFTGVGMVRAGSAAVAPNRGVDLRDQFYAAMAVDEVVK